MAPPRRRAPTNTSDIDPISLALLPPPDETPEERTIRLKDEARAKAVSDGIDEQIKIEREEIARKKKNGDVKILLLGQSESGKSTTIKNFQIMYSPNAWRAERITWRAVIFLNLVRSIRRILSALDDSHVAAGGTSNGFNTTFESTSTDAHPTNLAPSSSGQAAALPVTSPDSPPPSPVLGRNDPRARSPSTSKSLLNPSFDPLPPRLLELILRLSPLVHVENLLIKALSSDDPTESEFEATHLGTNQPGLLNRPNGKELFVTASHWKKALTKKLSKRPSSDTNSTKSGSSQSSDPVMKDDVIGTLRMCRDDMIALWTDPLVREILAKRRFRPQDSSGFFLNDIKRITAKDYVPTDQDVLNARLKTVGVIEHYFAFDRGAEKGVNWTLYDVGGARNQRHVWASFFDEVDSIIFLAPISAFNQVLAEDPRVNRVADSLFLFRAICENKLLAKVNIVLFLNKTDILQSKLEAGIQLKKYILSFGDRPNDIENACKYFRSKFGSVFRELSDSNRELYVHLTSVNDPESTSAIINNVRDTILRRSLQKSSLL